MGTFSIWHWLVVLLVVVLVFGTKKLGSLGTDLGEAVRGFKKGMKKDDDAAAPNNTNSAAQPNLASENVTETSAQEVEEPKTTQSS